MKQLKIHFLNTIWSDSILLESNNNFAFVDTGSKHYWPMIDEYLKNLNIEKLDFILLTHFHSDHYGNMKRIIDSYNVSKIYLKHYYGLEATTGSNSNSSEEYIENEMNNYNDILAAAKNNNTEIIFLDDLGVVDTSIHFQNVEIELYDVNNRLFEIYNNPNSEFYQQKRFNENFNSLGAFININNKNRFLGADVTCSNTDIEILSKLSYKMVQRYYNKHNVDNIDLYKACHHGGDGTNSQELCKLLKSNYTVITNTDRWLDNWDTYKNLKASNENMTILKTDYHKYIFDINNKITYQTIDDVSLFIKLELN